MISACKQAVPGHRKETAGLEWPGGASVTAIEVGHSGNNIGGLRGDFHRASMRLPGWQSLAPGASVTLTFVYYLPIGGPSNFTVLYGGTRYALKFEYPNLPVVN